MRLNNISFPYPVLRIDNDDVLPTLPKDCINITAHKTETHFQFEIRLKYDNPDITELINKGLAIHTCEIDCVKTVWRKSFQSKSPVFTIPIPRKDLSGNIKFSTYISVIKPIKEYSNQGFNSDYNGATFDMEPGDILAGFPTVLHYVDIKYDKLQAAGSFMIIHEDVGSDVTSYCFEHDKIEINLPSEMFKQYQNGIKSNFAEIMHSSLAYNALTCALYELPNCDDSLLWVQALKYRLIHEVPDAYDDEKKEIFNVPDVATKLLKDPYRRLFNKLIEQLENDSEENYG